MSVCVTSSAGSGIGGLPMAHHMPLPPSMMQPMSHPLTSALMPNGTVGIDSYSTTIPTQPTINQQSTQNHTQLNHTNQHNHHRNNSVPDDHNPDMLLELISRNKVLEGNSN